MKDVAKLLNEMLEKLIISNYAIFGAVAQMRYTEAVLTMDLVNAWKIFKRRFNDN